MKFLEDNCDFMDFEEDSEAVDVCVCHECGEEFEVGEGEEPKNCPACGIEFLPGPEC